MIWLILLALNQSFNFLNVSIAIFLSLIISFFSFKNKIINKKNEMLFLNLGFYRYFIRLFSANFFSSMIFLLRLAVQKNTFKARVFNLKLIDKKIDYPDIFKSSLMLKTGLNCLKISQDSILIRAEDAEFYDKKEINRMIKEIDNINDDKLV
jgi:hypothetical protein